VIGEAAPDSRGELESPCAGVPTATGTSSLSAPVPVQNSQHYSTAIDILTLGIAFKTTQQSEKVT
jgi:hypothetical protein